MSSSQKKIQQLDPQRQRRHEQVEKLGKRLGYSSEKIRAMSNVNRPMENTVEGLKSGNVGANVDGVVGDKFVPQTTQEHPIEATSVATCSTEGQFIFPEMTETQKQTLDAVLYSEGAVLESELQLKRNKLRYKLFKIMKKEQEFDAQGQCCWCGKTIPVLATMLQVHKWTEHCLHTAILHNAKSDHWFEDVIQIE